MDGYVFDLPTPLQRGEGLTVAVGFPKGVVTAYTQAEISKDGDSSVSSGPDMSKRITSFLEKHDVSIGISIVLLTCILLFWQWVTVWRDPKGTGVIIPQYDVPDNLTPFEVAGILNQELTAKDISAELIYLATQGHLKIKRIENTTLGIFKSVDYELSRITPPVNTLRDFDSALLNLLFSDTNVVTISSFKNSFYMNIPSIFSILCNRFLQDGYYKNLGTLRDARGGTMSYSNRLSIIIAVSIFLFFAYMTGSYIMSSVIVSIALFLFAWRFSPAKTDKGIATKEYLLGFKEYLQIAEKDRLTFHNAPEKNPAMFETFLPYAMVLGVDKVWAKEFESMYTTPPSWYEDNSMQNHFSAVAFGSSLATFSSFASSSLGSSPSSSGGSGGGGFSGGGGGGGGGGGW